MKKIILLLVMMMVISSVAFGYAEEYTVEEGDVLWKIARDNNVTLEELLKVNHIEDVNFIKVGQKIVIPEYTSHNTWEVDGFTQAESVLYVPNHDYIYVSNVNQEAVGFISRLNKDGSIDTLKFVENIPVALGMAYDQGKIYVASLNTVKVIDLETGRIINELVAEDGGMLNDITITPDGDLFVTDFMTHQIYRSNGEKLVSWLASEEFIMLNGIFFDYGQLLVSNMNMETMTGSVLKIDVVTKEFSVIKSMENIGAIDGISKLGNKYIASNATTRELLFFTEDEVESIRINNK